jgi:hypothetical protein
LRWIVESATVHAVNSKQVEAQGKFLDAIKIRAKRSNQAA